MSNDKDLRADILKIVGLLVGVIILGTISYHLIEGWPLFDCLYMTIITITTTGYREVGEMSIYGKILSMLLMFFGVGIFMYSINTLVPTLVERKIKKKEKMIEEMNDHYIVCGFGLIGAEVAKELPKDRVVIIDKDLNKISIAKEKGYVTVHGDATNEEVLEKAGVKRAKAIIGCMTDISNAFALITAKDLNPNIFTIAIVRNPETEDKLKRMGVDLILSPYKLVAKKIVTTLTRPGIIEFIETILSEGGKSFIIEKVVLREGKWIGKTLKELDLKRKIGCNIVAIVRNGELILPTPNTKLEKDDILFIIGTEDQLQKLEELL